MTFTLALFAAACGNNASATEPPTLPPTVTGTPDPCAPENIQAEVQKTHDYMREFDDASNLAAHIPVDQLPDAIANLQRIRREAEDQPTPPCLIDLKTYKISHMNVVINTLINLIGFANGTVDQQVIDQGIAVAREQHDKYALELARLLGVTPVPATVVFPPTQTPGP